MSYTTHTFNLKCQCYKALDQVIEISLQHLLRNESLLSETIQSINSKRAPYCRPNKHSSDKHVSYKHLTNLFIQSGPYCRPHYLAFTRIQFYDLKRLFHKRSFQVCILKEIGNHNGIT